MEPFKFKEFTVQQDKAAMKIGTDGVLLGAWAEVSNDVMSILDVGSGTGLIALMLAQRSNAETIDAVELDEDAYEQTVENFEASKWGDRLFCYHASFQEFNKEVAEENETYDFIISNPPFYTETYKTKNEGRNKARFTNVLSFEELLVGVAAILDSKGKFAVIVPNKEEEHFIDLAKKQNLFLNRICEVKGNEESKTIRSLMEFSFIDSETKKERLTIEKERHIYTHAFERLVKNFYLKL